jgi:hypothetical protein
MSKQPLTKTFFVIHSLRCEFIIAGHPVYATLQGVPNSIHYSMIFDPPG